MYNMVKINKTKDFIDTRVYMFPQSSQTRPLVEEHTFLGIT